MANTKMLYQMMQKFAAAKSCTAGDVCVPFKTDAITRIAGQSKSHYTRNTSAKMQLALTCKSPNIKKKPICTSKSLLFHENPHYTLRKMAIHGSARCITDQKFHVNFSQSPLADRTRRQSQSRQHPHLSLS
jgi:hypothetical protein